MDHRQEIRQFMMTRRAGVTPDRVGLPVGSRRRVAGLRRGEVAALAGVSVEYYARLERGELAGVTDGVLDAVAGALLLDPDQRRHLFDLARASRGRTRPTAESSAHGVRSGLARVVDTISAPALIVNASMDIEVANGVGRALYVDMGLAAGRKVNYAFFVFRDPVARSFYVDWDDAADEVAATLHANAGRDPRDARLTAVVGRLTEVSAEFRSRWAAQTVRQRSFGVKRLRHRGVGELELAYETLLVPTETHLALMIYTAAPGSTSSDALARLETWASEHMGSVTPGK